MIYSISFGFFGANLTWVGKPAPPIPTIPASFIALRIDSFEPSQLNVSLVFSYLSSFSITTQLTFVPLAIILGSIALTIPETAVPTDESCIPVASTLYGTQVELL